MKLIIINGPTGSGKSSLAEVVHKKCDPLAFLLRFDAQRRFLKDRHDNAVMARELVYKVCLVIAEECFKDGRDVVFEGVVYDAYFIENLITVAVKYKVSFYEFILWADKDVILDRNISRGLMPFDGLPDSRPMDKEKVLEIWYKMDNLKNNRHNASVIDVFGNNFQQMSDEVVKIIWSV